MLRFQRLLALLVGALLSSLCLSAPAGNGQAKTAKGATGVVQLPILHYNSDDTGIVPLVDVGIGNPPQVVRMVLDTGSSDLIAAETGSTVCKSPEQQCTRSRTGLVLGSFDPRQSEGVEKVAGQALDTSFGTGESYKGPMVKETLTLGGSQVSAAQIGLMETGYIPPNTPSFSVFGIGPMGNEGTAKLYVNVPAHMKEMGVINRNAFGIYLNDFRGSEGSITFGGIDTAKFEGKLQEMPLVRDENGKFGQFLVSFSSMSVSGREGTGASAQATNFVPQPIPALLDTGNPALDLSPELVTRMARELRVGTRKDGDVTMLNPVPCSWGDSMSLVLGFNQDTVKMSVPFSILMVPEKGGATGQCSMPQIIGSREVPFTSLGAPFLQAVYAVYDMDRNRISLAQAKMNTTETNIVPF
ncbi:eukaryotic aspartyl protease [Colletotrichum graminicola]|uniref:Eukaryotic aspartyl protease n=1 Tax=Colletotrichum graminicola (strain M1.001 / M2 / FGSC 10212) TaxID=645133 RepID=E3QQC5_COLGM|nr:eukaryotic aspartyl protease [Colletotrichum graminicola M1.001]EFQ33063.1 eukaryotic aspartyl protease [Colletotrichum graminicola M1.001]WDK22009.1 eukaryotic aspartyl protease [Colletotrichum graminicola]